MGSSGSKQSRNRSNSPHKSSYNNSESYNLDRNKFHSNGHRNLRTADSLSMPISATFKCAQCGMIFQDDEALFKHRTRFCIGTKESGIGRKLYYSDDEDNINSHTTDNYLTSRSTLPRMIKYQSSVEKKRDEINDWKSQRSILQNVQDMEDRIRRDSQKTQRLANDLKKRTHNYNQILTEYEKLQAQERDLLRQMFNLQGDPTSHLNHPNGLTQHERNQFESLQRQNARLEHERQIMQTKLEELIADNHPPTTVSSYEPYRLLRDMKETQDNNEKALQHLRRRLVFSENSLFTSGDISSLPYLTPSARKASDDLRGLRNSYLQTGGHNSDILDQYTDLERRLRHYEYYPWMRDYPEPLRHYRRRSSEIAVNKITAAQNENQRLQTELKDMQRSFDKLDSRTRQLELTVATGAALSSKFNDYHSYSTSNFTHYPPKDTSARQAYDSNSYDQRRNPYPSSLPALDRRTTSHAAQPTNFATSDINRLRDPLGPRPYDPATGFVIFFDFIIHFPSTIEQCRLITCIHHQQSGLGEPSQLAPCKCELYADQKSNEQTSVAVIATKQPVPSCPPEPMLTLVIEIQVTNKQARNEALRNYAWTKLPLFDHRNRLQSGRWKIPLSALPIRLNENFATISTLPTMGRAELHYRLVNFQDSAEQSNATVSPNLRDLYFYPPQLRSQP